MFRFKQPSSGSVIFPEEDERVVFFFKIALFQFFLHFKICIGQTGVSLKLKRPEWKCIAIGVVANNQTVEDAGVEKKWNER